MSGRLLDDELLHDLLGDGCLSDIEISDGETEPTEHVPRLLEEETPLQNQKNIQPLPADQSGNTESTKQKRRPKLWKADNFTDISHDYTCRLGENVKTPLQYFE